MYHTILVPIDLSETSISKSALDKADAIAQWTGAALRLLNLQVLLPSNFLDYMPADFDTQQRREAERALEKMALVLRVPPERVSTIVRVGGVYPEILAEADAFGADLIVIGSHRPAMSTYLLGSNAKTVVRHARCSVLVVRD